MEPFYLIAECGVHWLGDVEKAKSMVVHAKGAGFDAVKFQCFSMEQIKGIKGMDLVGLLKNSVTEDTAKEIAEFAAKRELDFICTPMYLECIEWLAKHVKMFKIREFDSRPMLEYQQVPLIDKCIATLRKVLVSTTRLPADNFYLFHPAIEYLFCVPNYPTMLQDIDFSHFITGGFKGFSCHCPDPLAPLTAGILGARVIEVHVTLDKTNPKFVDNPVSFEFEAIGQVIKQLRRLEKCQIRLSPAMSGLVNRKQPTTSSTIRHLGQKYGDEPSE